MIILGLTGSIGMGKSTCASMLQHLGVPVHDSDSAVHDLLRHDNTTIKAVLRSFPALSVPIDRKALGKIVFNDEGAREKLEAILHPRVRDKQNEFLYKMKRRGCKIAALDIPLLYETGAQNRVDYVAVVDAPFAVQAQRVLARPGMTKDVFLTILQRQIPNADKCAQADFILPTGLGRAYTMRCVRKMLQSLRGKVKTSHA